MPRALTAGILSELSAPTVRPIYFLELEFQGVNLNLCSDIINVNWDSKVWLGNGWFQGMGSIKEVEDIDIPSIEVTLSGVPETILSLVLSSGRQNKRGKLYLGFRDASLSIIADPVLIYDGNYDQASISDSPESSVVTIKYESDLSRIRKSQSLTYSDALQKSFYPADKGFEFVNSIADKPVFWGTKVKKLNKTNKKKGKK